MEMFGLPFVAQLDASTPPQNWWWSTLTSGPAMTMLVIGAGCVIVLLFLGWRLRRVAATERQPVHKATLRQRLSDDSGVAMMEFALVSPVLLVLFLVLVQAMLVFAGVFYVQYSAFAAARSAIVYIPTNSTEPINEINPVRGSEKFDAIHSSAVLAVMPVSGREDGSQVFASEIVEGVRAVYQAQGKSEPNWVDGMLAERLYYAVNHTEVVLEKVQPGSDAQTVRFVPVEGLTTFTPKEAIAARVEHEFALTVPVANRIFALGGGSGTYTPSSGELDTDSPRAPGRWTLIQARAILTNEGIDRRLPEKPPVPRR